MELKCTTQLNLPNWYKGTNVEICEVPLSVDLDIARWLSEQERKRGFRPTAVFRNVIEYPEAAVLGNPYPRQVVLEALGLSATQWQDCVWHRLQNPAPRILHVSEPWAQLDGLTSLPILKYRPLDAGRYITAGVVVCRSPLSGRINLGVYRIQVISNRRALIFFDPKTDAHRNWAESVAQGESLPVAVFLGANPAHILIAASRLGDEGDDYHFSGLLGQFDPLFLAGEPPVPIEASYVIFGQVTNTLELEGPFGEFKGYYVDARPSPVLEVERVLASSEALYPAIVTGAESGLTLMAMQNEYLMYCHLRQQGYSIQLVQYLIESRGEFTTLIEAQTPSMEIVRSAMNFDRRSKIFVCGETLRSPWDSLATHGFDSYTEPYSRNGTRDGDRIGVVLNRPPQGRPVEY